MKNQLVRMFGLLTLLSLQAATVQAASVSVTIEGKIDHSSNPAGSARLQFFGVEFNDLFAINFTYDDQTAPGNNFTPLQNYSATLGSTTYRFTNPSQSSQHKLTNLSYNGSSGLQDFSDFSSAQANFDLQGLDQAAQSSLRQFKASDAPLTLANNLFNSLNNVLFFQGENGLGQTSSIAGYVSSLSLAATPPLSAVPIPAALWLFVTGLIGLFGLKRRT